MLPYRKKRDSLLSRQLKIDKDWLENKPSEKRAKKSPHPAVAGLPNKDSGVRHWGLEPQTP